RKVKDDGNRRGDDPKEKKVVFGFRTVSVFDVSQTEGKPLPEFASLSGDPGELQMKLENVVTSKGIQLSYVDSLAGANGVSLDGRIEILEGLEPPQKFSTTVHELAHELLHRGDRRELTTKTIRETEAEAVAYAVCRWAGLECSSRASDYIQLYSGDEKVLMQSLEHIRDVSATIIEALESSTVNDCTTELVLTT
ncbi:MAG: hypothetical protein KDB03_05165, partial [Planctomycetales bacterium]|nr:hypothetical protein [Planctomycetales bacterium]